MRIIVASHNENKIKEFIELLPHETIVSLHDINWQDEIVENGNTFLDNAMIKVNQIAQAFPNDIIIGDDSGLCIKALNHGPGIYSARFMGDDASDAQKNQEIINLMENAETRSAYFACAIILGYGNYRFSVQQVVYGTIANQPLGQEGFGYDPIFIPQGSHVTFAQDHKLKQTLSHRARALKEIVQHVKYLKD